MESKSSVFFRGSYEPVSPNELCWKRLHPHRLTLWIQSYWGTNYHGMTSKVGIFSEKSHVTHFTLRVWIRTMMLHKSINIAVCLGAVLNTHFFEYLVNEVSCWFGHQKKPKGTTGGWQLVSMWLVTPMYKPWLYNHGYEPLTFCGMILQVPILWPQTEDPHLFHCIALPFLGPAWRFGKLESWGHSTDRIGRSMISMYRYPLEV